MPECVSIIRYHGGTSRPPPSREEEDPSRTFGFVRKLGEGGQGVIHLVKRHSKNEVLVRKTVCRPPSDQGPIKPREVQTPKNIVTKHERIVRLEKDRDLGSSLILHLNHCRVCFPRSEPLP